MKAKLYFVQYHQSYSHFIPLVGREISSKGNWKQISIENIKQAFKEGFYLAENKSLYEI